MCASLPPSLPTLLFLPKVLVSQPLTGVECINYYMISLLETSGVESRRTQFSIVVCIGAVKLSVVLLASRFFDCVGRRPLLLVSNVGMGASLGMLALNYRILASENDGAATSSSSPVLAIAALLLFSAFLNVGMGAGPGLVASEIFSIGFRGKAVSLARFCSRSVAAAASSSFLTLREELTDAGVALLFALFCLANAVFVLLILPETKGLTLEQMRETFEHAPFPCTQVKVCGRSGEGDDEDDDDDDEKAAFQLTGTNSDVGLLGDNYDDEEDEDDTENPLNFGV
jgi:hypothetical protein